jgi:hypothetical protein
MLRYKSRFRKGEPLITAIESGSVAIWAGYEGEGAATPSFGHLGNPRHGIVSMVARKRIVTRIPYALFVERSDV